MSVNLFQLAVLDEFDNLSKINPLKEGVSFLRSYHLICLVLVQYLSQITSVCGVNKVKVFLNTKIKVTFTLNDRYDVDYFSKALGQKKLWSQTKVQIQEDLNQDPLIRKTQPPKVIH